MIGRRIFRCLITAFWFPIVFSSIEASRISLDSKLSVMERDYWVSSDGNFAFGFFNDSNQPNQYIVGIRFNSVSIPFEERALVWAVGGGAVVGYDSFVHLTISGDLVLFDSSKGVAVWSSNTGDSSVASASLLDSGNLVLLNRDQNVVWQSFRTPTDTLLPGQNLTSLQTLRATGKESVSSYYSLSMNTSGQLRLSWETNITYWESEATSLLPIRSAVLTKAGAFQLLDQRSRPVWSRYGDDHNDSTVSFRFLRLDPDGNFLMYSWAEASKSWRKVWQAVENQCDVFATCGQSGVCVFTPSGNATCRCPFSSIANSDSNCFTPYDQNCDSGTTMVALEHTFLYGIYPPKDSITQSNVEQCRDSCLQDPLCTSVTATNDGKAQCRMKQTRYITGYGHPSLTSISFFKVCQDPVAALPSYVPASPYPSVHSPSLEKSPRSFISSIVGMASAALIVFLGIQIAIGLSCLRRRTIENVGGMPSSMGLVSLSYSEVKDITDNFKHRLGLNLYKGMLLTNHMVVIKELKCIREGGEAIDDKHFRYFVSIFGGIHHKNLVKLKGYCYSSDRMFLMYEYVKNSSVAKWIVKAKLSRRLTWRKRVQILLGVARALTCLHSECMEFVSHGNLKWENVLLDEDLEAKVTEFGLGRLNPEAAESSQGAEVDVKRFGEMVVELVSGRTNMAEVCSWAYKEWEEGHAVRVVDPRLGGRFDEEVEHLLRIAFWCIQPDARLRPTMGEVKEVLEGSLPIDPPPPPYICMESMEGTLS